MYAFYNTYLHCLRSFPSREQLNFPCTLEYNLMVAVSLMIETEPLAKNKKQYSKVI